MNPVKKFYIESPQDPSVGIFACSAEVNLDGFEVLDEDELSWWKQELQKLFSKGFDDSQVRVYTDAELEVELEVEQAIAKSAEI